jgi:hypothetical protein
LSREEPGLLNNRQKLKKLENWVSNENSNHVQTNIKINPYGGGQKDDCSLFLDQLGIAGATENS